MGSMSVMGFEERKRIFRPLIPDVDFITFNNESDLEKITTKTAELFSKPFKEVLVLLSLTTIS